MVLIPSQPRYLVLFNRVDALSHDWNLTTSTIPCCCSLACHYNCQHWSDPQFKQDYSSGEPPIILLALFFFVHILFSLGAHKALQKSSLTPIWNNAIAHFSPQLAMVYHSLLFRSFQTKTCLVLFSKDALSSRVDLIFFWVYGAQQVSPRWPASEYQN